MDCWRIIFGSTGLAWQILENKLNFSRWTLFLLQSKIIAIRILINMTVLSKWNFLFSNRIQRSSIRMWKMVRKNWPFEHVVWFVGFHATSTCCFLSKFNMQFLVEFSPSLLFVIKIQPRGKKEKKKEFQLKHSWIEQELKNWKFSKHTRSVNKPRKIFSKSSTKHYWNFLFDKNRLVFVILLWINEQRFKAPLFCFHER